MNESIIAVGQTVTWDDGRMRGVVLALSDAGRAFVKNTGKHGAPCELVPVTALTLVGADDNSDKKKG